MTSPPLAHKLDGVAKSSIYCVVAGSANARRTLCTPARGRHHHALYIELLCLAISSVSLSFCVFIKLLALHHEG